MLKEFIVFIKDIKKSFDQKIDLWSEIINIEYEVRKLSNHFFLDAFKQVAYELSEITGIPYLTYLKEAKKMLMQGVGMQDTMYHFDSIWFDLKFGKPLKEGDK